jgi:GalNAc-alpha-(1->4)-GalNAc-alpha-(1->3)-diNAcBac-PP-undecaprenol alpha-1,4-N-acetyl-D-galactosaminyltransferase
VPVRDVDLLARRLEALISNTEIRNRLSREAAKIGDNFALEKISDDYLAFCTAPIK